MKKLLSVLLCAALVLGTSAACAEEKPWLRPFFSFVKNMLLGEETTRAELRFSMAEVQPVHVQIEADTDADEELAADIRTLLLGQEIRKQEARNNERSRACRALFNASVLEITTSRGLYRAALLVDGKPLADVTVAAVPQENGVKFTMTTSLLPSFAFVTVKPQGDSEITMGGTLGECLAELISLSETENGITPLGELMEVMRKQVEYFLAGGDCVTLDKDKYQALSAAMPGFDQDSLAVLNELLWTYTDTTDFRTMNFFAAPTDASGHAEKIDKDTYAMVISYMEEGVDDTNGAEGERPATGHIVTQMMTVGETTASFAEVGHADAAKDKRMFVDLSEKNAPRVVLDSGMISGTAEFSRDESAQNMAIHFFDDTMTLNGLAQTDGDGRFLSIIFETEVANAGKQTIDFTANRLEGAARDAAPDLSGRTVIEADLEDGGFVGISEAEEKLIQDELYNVTRPKLIDFAFAGLPKGAEALTPVLLVLVTQLGR